MALQKEAWLQDIQENLYAGIGFVTKAVNHDGFVDDDVVHLPQAGSGVSVEKNRTSLPATVGQRTDTDRTYTLDEYTSNPVLVRNIDKIQLSYPKRQSVLKEFEDKIYDEMGKNTAYEWAGSTLKSAGGQIVETTGTATAGIAPPSGTGNRKSVDLADLADAASKMDEDNFSLEGRWMLFPAVVYWNMLTENTELLNSQYMSTANLPSGVVAKIFGFNVMLRSYTAVYTNATTPVKKAVGSAAATDDNWGVIGWHQDAVCKAMGTVNIFSKEEAPEYYGDVVSALMMFKAKGLRTDGKGIVTIVQST